MAGVTGLDLGTVAGAIELKNLASATIKKISGELAAFEGQLRGATAATERLSLARVAGQISATGSALASTGRTLTAGFSLPLAAAAAGLTKFAMDFDTSMTKVETLSGVAAGQAQKFREEIMRISPELGRGPRELADAMLVITSTGLRGAEAMEVLRESARASSLGLGETKDIARAVVAAMNAYGKENLSAAEATRQLFVAVREGGAEASEFAGTLGRVIGIAKSVGVSFAEATGFIATFTRLGVDASEATTALRGVLSTLLGETQEGVEALDRLGLTLEELRAIVREKGLHEAIIMLTQSFKGNEDALAAVFGNVRALAGVMGVAKEQADAYRAVVKQVATDTGGMEEAHRRAQESVGKQWEDFKAKVEATAIALGEKLIPRMREALDDAKPLVDALGKAGDAYGKLPDSIQKASLSLVALGVAAGPVLWIVGNLTRVFGGLLNVVKWLALTGLPWLLRHLKDLGAVLAGVFSTGLTNKVELILGRGSIIGMAIFTVSELTKALRVMTGSWRDAIEVMLGGLDVARAAKIGMNLALPAFTVAPRRSRDIELVNPLRGNAQSSVPPSAVEAERLMLTERSTAAGGGAATFVQQMKAARAAIAKLTPEIQAELRAAFKMPQFNDAEISKRLGLSISTVVAFRAEVEKLGKDGDEAGKAMRELADSLSGREVVAEARRWVAVVAQVGGATRLTQEQQEEYNAVLSEAIDYYRRIGQEAPAAFTAAKQAMTLTLPGMDTSNSLAAMRERGVRLSIELASSFAAGIEGLGPSVEAVMATYDGESLAAMKERGARLARELAGSFMAGASGLGPAPQVGFLQRWLGADSLREYGAVLTRTITGALQGGGAVGQAVGSQIGGDLFGGLTRKLLGYTNAAGEAVSGMFTKGLGKLGKTFGPLLTGVLGSAIPVVGSFLGSLGGSLLGKLFGGNKELKQARATRDEIIAQAGGLAELQKQAASAGFSLDKFMSARKESQVKAEIEKLNAALKATQERLQKLASDLASLSSRGGLVTPDLLKRLMADSGREEMQQALGEFARTETERAASGLSGAVLARGETMRLLAEAQKQVADLEASGGSGEEFALQLKDAHEQAEKLRQQLEAMPLTAAGAQAFGAGLAAAFAGLVEGGASPLVALQQIGPAVTSLGEQLTAAGLSGGPAFAQLASMAAVATDAISGPAVAAVASLGEAMTGLHNTGWLNQEMFAGLASQVSATFAALQAQGKGGDDALRLMQPTLQKIWQLQQDFGYEVDDATKALMDQAEASGLVGDKFRPAADQMVSAIKGMTDRLGELVTLLSQRLGTAARDGARQIQDALGREVVIPYRFEGKNEPPSTGDVPGYASGTGGRFVNFGRGTLAELHGYERIMTPGEGGGLGQQIVQVFLDREVIAEAAATGMPGVLRVYGV